MFGRLYKIIFTTSWYPLKNQWGYVHGMSLDLDKYIYPNCLNKVTAYVCVALLLRNKKECVLIKLAASFNIIILMVLRRNHHKERYFKSWHAVKYLSNYE